MEDYEKITTPSSPNLIASGNNENETENHRNSQRKTKNFMSPTISASSKMISPKMISPKKRILAERKPPYLESKFDLYKMGTSNSNSRNSLMKNPLISSPKNGVLNSDENLNDEEKSVLDSCTKPYDPLTNYLSPRPKYLRYNPNRKRKLSIQRGKRLSSTSLNGSIGCLSSSGSESSSNNEEIEGVKEIDEQKKVKDDNDDDDEVEEEVIEGRNSSSSSFSSSESSSNNEENEEVKEIDEHKKVEDDNDDEVEEEVIEGRNWGFKWAIFKGLIVFFAWLFFILFISSMNVPTSSKDSSISGSKIGYENFENVTLRVVSFLKLDMIETPAKIVASSEEKQKYEKEDLELDLDSEEEEDDENLDYVYEKIKMNADFYQLDGFKDEDEDIPEIVERQNERGEVEILDSGLNSENGVKEIVAPVAVHDQNVVNQEEKVVDFEEKMNNGDSANEVEVVAEGSSDVVEQKKEGEFVNETIDSVSSDVPLQNVTEVPYVEPDHNVVIQEEKLVDFDEKVNVRPNVGFENEVVAGAEGSSNGVELKNEGVQPGSLVGVNFAESLKQLRLLERDRVVLGAVSLMIWVGIIMVFICWRKCKKASTRTNTSRRRINPRVERSQTRRSVGVGLPLTADEGLDQVHQQESDSQVMNTNLSSALAGEGAFRRFPGVKQLGELEFTRGFSGSVKTIGLRSGNMQEEDSLFTVPDDRKAKRSKGSHTPPPPSPESTSSSSMFSEKMTTMQMKEDSLFAVPDDRKAKRSKGSHTLPPPPPESTSSSSMFSEKMTTMDSTGEVSAVRRSERLRNRGITSP